MTRVFVIIFFGILSLLYLTGVVCMLLSLKRSKEILAPLRFALILMFFAPFLAYFLAGLVNIKFGWERNFFYLLPIYLLVIFYCLKTIIKNKRYYYVISAIILALLLWAGIDGSISWERVNAERELIRCAARLDSDLIIVCGRGAAKWPFIHYGKLYGVQNKVIFLQAGTIKERCFAGYSAEEKSRFSNEKAKKKEPDPVVKRLSNVDTFIIMEVNENCSLLREGRYHIGENSFEIVKIEQHKVKVGPYQFLKDLLRLPSPCVTIYFCKK